MRYTKKIIAGFIAISMLCCNINVDLMAQDNMTVTESEDYIKQGNCATWGKIIDDVNYLISVYDDGNVYVVKMDLKDENMSVVETNFHIDSNFEYPEYTEEYWQAIVAMSSKSRALWNVVDNIEVSAAPIAPGDGGGTSTLTSIKTKLMVKYGTTYTQKLLKTDTTSYPGYSFKVKENHTHGVVQCNSVEFEKTTTLGAMAIILMGFVPGLRDYAAVKVISTLAAMYDLAAGANTLMNQNGNLIPYYCTVVLSRYTNVNGGSVNYSEATKKITTYIYYDTEKANSPLGELVLPSTAYSPSEYSFSAPNYQWLIQTAYKNYS